MAGVYNNVKVENTPLKLTNKWTSGLMLVKNKKQKSNSQKSHSSTNKIILWALQSIWVLIQHQVLSPLDVFQDRSQLSPSSLFFFIVSNAFVKWICCLTQKWPSFHCHCMANHILEYIFLCDVWFGLAWVYFVNPFISHHKSIIEEIWHNLTIAVINDSKLQ